MLQESLFIMTNEWSFLVILSIFVFILFLKHRSFDVLELLTSLSLVSLLTLTLKSIFAISRPVEALFTVQGYAFPSLHAAIAATIGVMLYILFVRPLHHKTLRILADLILIIFIFFIGFTRLWFQVHTLTDIIVGYILGILAGTMAVIFFRFVHTKGN